MERYHIIGTALSVFTYYNVELPLNSIFSWCRWILIFSSSLYNNEYYLSFQDSEKGFYKILKYDLVCNFGRNIVPP